MKFTFKTIKPTGKYKHFYEVNHEIKFNKQEVGSIDDKGNHTIRLKVVKSNIMEDGNPNCTWKNIALPYCFNSVLEAKEFLNKNIEDILKLNLKM